MDIKPISAKQRRIIIVIFLLVHAIPLAWIFLPMDTVHHFIGGPIMVMDKDGIMRERVVTNQWFAAGFGDCLVRFIYSGFVCWLLIRVCKDLAWFFYCTFAFYSFNTLIYWYNYCQWKAPFYIMLFGLVVAAAVLWPKSRLRVVK